MKKSDFSLIFVFLCLLISSLFSYQDVSAENQESESKNGIKHAFVDSSVFDFGEVLEGSVVEHLFEVRAEAALSIHKVVPSCGCTVAKLSSTQLKAGERAQITVTFDTAGFIGDKLRTIEVLTDDPLSQQITLTLKGKVVTQANVAPRIIDFGELNSAVNLETSEDDRSNQLNTTWHKDFSVSLAAASKYKLGDATSFSKHLAVVQTEISSDRRSAKYRLTLLSSIPKGEIRERVTVDLAGEKPFSLTVPVVGVVRSDLRLKPQTVSFGVISGKEPITRRVVLDSKAATPVKVIEVKTSHQAIKANVDSVKPGRTSSVSITLDPAQVFSDLRGVVTVVTDHPTEKELSLSVFAVMPAKL